ncbi:centrosomal protein of 112 kDa-like isoform X1 [Vidua chalybeata]|uniref:centrosomal protein of 112 kDa-like isoform X1 n=1 Tax=Vidua chalybeata TaxID=81927 RepID=UPI0023A8843C|nr:centrosomal protein of 112 kDa-like isoform X1 [Vidua chalybeata]XP_053814358.1 centrosomal protein of 112 kDa-like isoform X1 [Vidua chalybeata]XP_053814359.1 centrosomal protein of 112 kDa-like isoform X1 [Vidua chalybeata]
MSSEDEIKEKLDAELDRYVMAMKPYVLNLQNSSERERCSLWIKNLCKPSEAGIGIVERENRNLYTKLLLHVLQRGVLNGPFSQKLEEGMLKTLPAYMSVYFDEPSSPKVGNSRPDCLPEWMVGELGNHDSNVSSVEDLSSATTPAHGLNEKPLVMSRCLSSSHWTDEDDLGTSLSLEMKMKTAEGKFDEEKLKLQQKHHADVQKTLDRKNDEIDVLKSTYLKKQKESEDMIRKLEKKRIPWSPFTLWTKPHWKIIQKFVTRSQII